MKRGLVVGEVWATKMAPGLESRSLKLVVEYPAHGAAVDIQVDCSGRLLVETSPE